MSQRELPVILLIDDDLVSREVSATLLTLSGFTVHTAENGETALKMLEDGKCQPGVILSDLQMPGLSGTDLIGALRAACGQASIYVTSGSQPEQSIVSAADGLLLKPFDGAALLKLLEGQQTKTQQSYLEPDEPVINKETLAKLREMMPEKAVREIYTAVVTDLERRIEALGAAFAKHDEEAVRRIGHAIKGGCGMAGALQAARLGALLESKSSVQDNQFDNGGTLLNDLRAAANALQRILDKELLA